ncbi:MAG: c-type cytochrome [Hallerella porci]|uniref:c-type cytochrome n=1 Tax=Hallerella porci TaxID=1945871 RepID=UPI002A7EDB84|nr:c-type cytochrome [Hallerella porci]MDY3922138.1 c-type cytochrome [Hallerella porci]
MNRYLLIFGIILLIPGLIAVDFALAFGPASWAISQKEFWGTPISNFVFWIGLAHAGTFFSAILLVLGARFQHRIALIAEFSTLASLVIAGSFPLIHLGIPSRFDAMIPFGNVRTFLINPESPLTWDFVAILAYTTASTLFLLLHLLKTKFSTLESFRRPMAWILFPLVLWVHTIVSLDFAVTFVPEWQGAYFPLYFISGALFSGIALVQILLELLKRRVRRIESLLITFSWAMLSFWIWEALTKNIWHPEILVFGFLIPQLLWIPSLRERSMVRASAALAVIISLWWERILLVQKNPLDWTWVDIGLLSFGIGLFCVLFALLRIFTQKFFAKALDEESAEELPKNLFAKRPFFFSILLGVFCAAGFVTYFICNASAFPILRIVPFLLPIAALVAIVSLSGIAAWKIFSKSKVIVSFIAIFCALVSASAWIYRGHETAYDEDYIQVKAEKTQTVRSEREAEKLFNARCASCHGKDGKFNKKFVREYYPLPQKLSRERIDSLGVDSLSQVILNGRNYMQAFRGRVSESEANALVMHLKKLAEKNAEAK